MKTLNYNNSEIRFGNLTDTAFNKILNSDRYKDAKKVIITDENVFELWIEHFITEFDELSKAEIIQIPAGEASKSLEICNHIWEALCEYEIGRNDLIINIGGGMITDLGGFIAATFKRGMSFINIPTTLLAQVDASVGGKTGIDLGPYKNQIGVFADADFVFIDTAYLSTLPEIEMESGYAEMLKHGLIAYKNYWSNLIKSKPNHASNHLLDNIRTSVSIKRDIVSKDHQEAGIRKNLNFGHTIGHALEGLMLTNDTPIPHGFGVAWGMIAESYLSKEQKLISDAEFNEINTGLRKIYTPIPLDETAIPQLMKLMLNDKKNSNGNINFTLLSGIGSAVHNQVIPNEKVEAALNFILNPSI